MTEPLGPLVALTPRRSLEFNLQQILDGEKFVSVRLQVRNISKENVAFKVKTTHLGWYYVKPNQDVLAQGESKEVLITLTDAESKRLLEAASQGVFESLDRHRFRIQTKIITAQDYEALSAVSMHQKAAQSVHIWGADSAAANSATSRADERLRVELTYPGIFQKGAAAAALVAADLSLDHSLLQNHVNVTAASPISGHAQAATAAATNISTSTASSSSSNNNNITTTTSSIAISINTSASKATAQAAHGSPGEPSPETSPEHQRERSSTARLGASSPIVVLPAPAAAPAMAGSPDSQAFPVSPSSQPPTSPASSDAPVAASPQLRDSSVPSPSPSPSASPSASPVQAAAPGPVPQGKRLNVLVCASGSVATVKVPELVVLLSRFANVRVLLSSPAAAHFWGRAAEYNPAAWADFVSAGGPNMVIDESIEWEWERLGDVVGHIAVRKWAHLTVLAPASADILAKVSAGQADSLLLSVLRAWDFRKPCLVCPAMNTLMWDHPATKVTLLQMRLWGWRVLEPVDKVLACNERGAGALVGLDVIVAAVREGLAAYGQGGLAEEDTETLLPCLRPEYLHSNVWKAPASSSGVAMSAQRHPVRASLTAALVTASFALCAAVGQGGGMAVISSIGADVLAKAALADIWSQSQMALGDAAKYLTASLKDGLKSVM